MGDRTMKHLALFAFGFASLAACETPSAAPTLHEPTAASLTATASGADVYGVGAGSINLSGIRKFAKFAFSGHSGPQGDFGSSRLTIDDPSAPLDVHVDVDCVNVFPSVLGGGGWIGGVVTKATPQPNVFEIKPGDQLLFGINDSGEPSDPIADEYNAFRGSPQLCKQLGPFEHIPIDQGNIVIKTG
jgi:hypothetical protein